MLDVRIVRLRSDLIVGPGLRQQFVDRFSTTEFVVAYVAPQIQIANVHLYTSQFDSILRQLEWLIPLSELRRALEFFSRLHQSSQSSAHQMLLFFPFLFVLDRLHLFLASHVESFVLE